MKRIDIQDLAVWETLRGQRIPLDFTLELTRRCNNECRHCYINLPAGDRSGKSRELTLPEISRLADEAVSLGAFWCLLTGGEPLLRTDFADVYLLLREKGLLVSVFTNATLVTLEHVTLFQQHPPRDMEVTVYGVSRETYEAVTRTRGSFKGFIKGVNLLLQAGVKIRFKAMALRSNRHEMAAIAKFCRERTRDYFRFDPVLHLRLDRNSARNEDIRQERLAPQEVVMLERSDPARFQTLQKHCDQLIQPRDVSVEGCLACADKADCERFDRLTRLFGCEVGQGSFYITHDGSFQLCASLAHPECVYDWRQGSLRDAWENFVPKVRARRTKNRRLLQSCKTCPLVNLCLHCPAHAHLETGALDGETPYFCEVAQARAAMLEGRG